MLTRSSWFGSRGNCRSVLRAGSATSLPDLASAAPKMSCLRISESVVPAVVSTPCLCQFGATDSSGASSPPTFPRLQVPSVPAADGRRRGQCSSRSSALGADHRENVEHAERGCCWEVVLVG
eukprot:10949942-Alexandrium_andersonii.AAC.1